MPSRLRPTASIAADAILVGDPGRALLLAQELLVKPKMSNHARGLWGYSGQTAAGDPLTIQSTGMGGPSAAIVLTDLTDLGLKRAIRIGTCTAVEPTRGVGELLVVAEAYGEDSMALPDPGLTEGLARELEEANSAAVASVDHAGDAPTRRSGVAGSDLQTATVLARGKSLGLTVAAVLIVEETTNGVRIDDDDLERAARVAGSAATSILST